MDAVFTKQGSAVPGVYDLSRRKQILDMSGNTPGVMLSKRCPPMQTAHGPHSCIDRCRGRDSEEGQGDNTNIGHSTTAAWAGKQCCRGTTGIWRDELMDKYLIDDCGGGYFFCK